MLRYVRAQLLERDNAGCLQRLKTYPPIEDVGRLVELAIKLYRNEPTPELDGGSSSSSSTGVAHGATTTNKSSVSLGSDPLSMAANALSSVAESGKVISITISLLLL